MPDGRVVSYVEGGVRDGEPVLYFEGSPGQMRLRSKEQAAAADAGVRVVMVHRPGYRESTPRPHCRLNEWPADVERVADQLGMDRFGLIGHSAGGAPTLACAWAIPERLSGVAVSSGFAPFDFDDAFVGAGRDQTLLFRIGRRVPRLVGPLLRPFIGKASKDPRAFVEATFADAPPSERADLDEEFLELIVQATTGQVEARGAGLIGDLEAVAAPWGFRPEDITIPVHLWYGEADASKIEHGRRLAKLIPEAITHFCPGEAHEVASTHFAEIIDAVRGPQA
jgi:pimeloyl-ACP methyl ester carboxylesterase